MADRKSSLTPPQARLVDLMQRLNFGRIEDLHVLNGEPLFDPPPRVFRDVRPGRDNGPRPQDELLLLVAMLNATTQL